MCIFLQLVNGKISAEGFKAVGAKLYEGDEKSIKVFNELIDICSSVTDPDECDLSAKHAECMIGEAMKRGIDPIKGIQE